MVAFTFKRYAAVECKLGEGPERMSEPALELSKVTKCYGDFTAVQELSLTVPTGSIYGFLGPNGAGKTTSIRMILDIIQPTRGTIRILGERSAMRVRHRLGYLPEEKGLYKKMKAWSIIAYFATLKGLSSSAAKRRAHELLERYGLKDFTEARTEALSKGMSQKVQMLATIAHDPEFIILDEPFSGLDPVNQQVLEGIIRDLASRNRTILFSTHVMQHAERLCDRVVLIAKGQRLFDGTIAEAKRLLPRRVQIETEDDIQPLRALAEVEDINLVPAGNRDDVREPGSGAKMAKWELRLRETADAQGILQACFAQGVRLRSFHQVETTLHEVFVHIVGPEAREVHFR